MLSPVQSLWIGDRLSNMEKLCAQSFMDHGHEFHLYTYAHVDGVPAGVVIKDANEIIPAEKIFRHKGGSYAPFADWFRYALMVKRGGWWVDTDMACLKPFDFGGEIVFLYNEGCYGNSPLHFPPAHPLMAEMEKRCVESKTKAEGLYEGIGGLILTELVLKFDMKQYGKPYTYFSPHSYTNWAAAFDNTFADGKLFANTYCVHFHNDMLRLANISKDAQFDSDSLFEQLKRKHNIAQTHDAQRITSENLRMVMTEKNFYGFLARIERRRKRKQKIITMLACIVAAATLIWFL